MSEVLMTSGPHSLADGGDEGEGEDDQPVDFFFRLMLFLVYGSVEGGIALQYPYPPTLRVFLSVLSDPLRI